jgi:peptidoglycan/LPS O-acetylase OafA/YrhL
MENKPTINRDKTQPSAPLSNEQAPESKERHVASSEYNVAFAYLRAFIIVLVVIHHTAVAYFLIGIILGAYGIQRTLLVPYSTLTRRWVMWVVATLASFLANIVATFARVNQTLVAVSFLLFCEAACFAFLSIFLRFAGNRSRILDSLFRNSYGIYVIHYVVVNWLLYAMLRSPLPATAKGSIVFVCSLALCWGTISIIRRIPGVARVI